MEKIPGCDVLCPFDKFIDLLQAVTPSEAELECDKSKKAEEIKSGDIDNNEVQ